ncbi:DUF1707 SHOCT-like domain-containing protein [Blastococcus sp. SYSU DS1024]
MATEGPDATDEAMPVSDKDRQAVIEQLTSAARDGRLDSQQVHHRSEVAHTARTRGELMALVEDLASTSAAQRQPAAEQPATAAPIVGIFGGTERRGRWRPAPRQTVLALFGGVELDLREAELPPDLLDLRAWAVFGGVKIIMPEGMRVETIGGFSLFGGSSAKPSAAPTSDLPVLRLNAIALFGGVTARVEPTRRP